MSGATRLLELGDVELESGAVLTDVRVAFRTWGTLERKGRNAVLVCHALTGSADVDAWWGGLLGAGRSLDPGRDFIVCSNVLGSCCGTTGPTSLRPDGARWGADFPAVSVRDMVHVQARLLDRLGVETLRLVIGGSLGGMQTLEWAASYPARVEAIVPIATSGRHSAWCIALSAAQRAAITADPRWLDGRYQPEDPPSSGLAVARMIAMCTYRSREALVSRFGRQSGVAGGFDVEGYLRRQGEKLVARFDANAYLTLTRSMDGHDLGRDRGGYEQALRSIACPALVVAIDSDVLYPPEEQWELVEGMRAARLAWLRSPLGHDAFLVETERLDGLVRPFRESLARAA